MSQNTCFSFENQNDGNIILLKQPLKIGFLDEVSKLHEEDCISNGFEFKYTKNTQYNKNFKLNYLKFSFKNISFKKKSMFCYSKK